MTRLLTLVRPILTSPQARWMSQSVKKNDLSILRKKTGLAYTLCKNALEMHNNDIKKAEQWLKAEAKRRGWEKAAKLQGRVTTQGLIGIHHKNNIAAMVEVNCESDFVARNQQFKELVSHIAARCHRYATEKHLEHMVEKWSLNSSAITTLSWENDTKISDLVAVCIGKMGENMMVNKALCIKVSDGITLSCATHPDSTLFQGTMIGKFGAVVAYRQLSNEPAFPKHFGIALPELGRQLCQHIVGMNPRSLGNGDDKPADDPEEEDKMLFQEFIFNTDMIVKDILFQYEVELLDFARLECGESVTEDASEK